ncbi:uncharacterized protein [Watersipora subatra]|uniref:uncharacterized protein n=1 Tax=Watersipora subatra TaxID=2589382 RepID=UPI00355BF157
MSGLHEQCKDIREMASSGLIGKGATACGVIGAAMLAAGFVCLVVGWSSAELPEYGEHLQRVKSNPLWFAGMILLLASGTLLALSLTMCVCLCLYQSSTGARRMPRKAMTSERQLSTPSGSLPPMTEIDTCAA